jgi:carbonic anhydrase
LGSIDDLILNADRYAATFDKSSLPMSPAKPVAIVVCMDTRLNPHASLGLVEGDVHVILNAGGVVANGVIRSLNLSQRLLGKRLC